MRWRARPDVRCPQCDTTAPVDARWCGSCGAVLRPTSSAIDERAEQADRPRGDSRVARVVAAGLLGLLLVGLLVAQSATEPPAIPAGFTARGDGARSGVVSTTPVAAPSAVAWRTPVELPPLLTPGTGVLGVTQTPDGRELVVVHDPSPDGQRITAHDATDGAIVATTMLPLGSMPYSLTLDGGLLAHRDLTSVTLVDLATGAHRWRVEVRLRDTTHLTPAGVVGVPATADGPVLVLLGLDDGTERWRRPLGETGRVNEILWVDDRIVAAGVDDAGGFLVGLDPTDGSIQWALDASDLGSQQSFPLAPTVGDDGLVVVALDDDLLLVQPSDGSARRLVDEEADSIPPVVTAVGDGLVVRSDGFFTVVAYDVETGARRWAVPAPRAPILAMSVNGDLIAVRSDDSTALLAADTGAIEARIGVAGGNARLVATGDGAIARVTPEATVELLGTDGVRWQQPTIAVPLPDLATDEGAVAVTTPDGVEVHDVEDGERRFAHEAFEPDLVIAGSLTPPVLLGGRVFLAPGLTQPAARGGLLSLFADTGIVDWARDDDRVVPRGTPVVDRDLVVLPVGSQLLGFDRTSGRRALVVETTIARHDVAAAGGWLAAVDAPRDRGDLWVGRRATRDIVFRAPIRACAPPVLHDDLVIVVDDRGDIVARRLEDGEQPWGERASGSACRPLSVASDVLLALVDDRELLAVTLADGETAWRLELPATAAGAPVVAGDQVLVPTLAGEVVAYDVAGTTAPDGPAWRVAIDGIPAGAVAVEAGTVMVMTREGELVGLR